MQNSYGKLYKLDRDLNVVQAYANLATVKDDFGEAKLAASFLGIDDFGPNDSYIINQDLDDPDKSVTKK